MKVDANDLLLYCGLGCLVIAAAAVAQAAGWAVLGVGLGALGVGRDYVAARRRR